MPFTELDPRINNPMFDQKSGKDGVFGDKNIKLEANNNWFKPGSIDFKEPSIQENIPEKEEMDYLEAGKEEKENMEVISSEVLNRMESALSKDDWTKASAALLAYQDNNKLFADTNLAREAYDLMESKEKELISSGQDDIETYVWFPEDPALDVRFNKNEYEPTRGEGVREMFDFCLDKMKYNEGNIDKLKTLLVDDLNNNSDGGFPSLVWAAYQAADDPTGKVRGICIDSLSFYNSEQASFALGEVLRAYYISDEDAEELKIEKLNTPRVDMVYSFDTEQYTEVSHGIETNLDKEKSFESMERDFGYQEHMDDHIDEKRNIIDVLGTRGYESSVQPILKILSLEDTSSPLYFEEAIGALGNIGKKESAEKLIDLIKSDDLEAEVKDRILKSFTGKYFEKINTEIFSDSSINFQDLSFAEQGHVVMLLETGGDNTANLISSLASEFGINGLRVVLSISENEMELLNLEGILEQGLTPDQKLALDTLFAKYSFIINSTNLVDEYLSQKEENEEKLTGYEVKRNMLHRGGILLKQWLQKITEIDFRKINHDMADLQKETLLLTQTIRTALEKGGSLEQFKEIAVRNFSGSTVAQNNELKQVMIDLYKQNWQDKTSPQYLEKLIDNFEKSLEQEKSNFYVLFDEDKLIGYTGFKLGQDKKDSYVKAFGFNVKSSYQSSKIGEAFLLESLQKQKELGLEIRAETNPSNPMLVKYKEMGFEVYGEYESQGEPMVLMRIPAMKQSN